MLVKRVFNMKETVYRKNDILRFMTSDPAAHVVRMFPYGDVKPEEVEKEEYIGRVKSVIADGKSYIISSIAPLKGFICITDAEDILGKMEEKDLTEEQRKEYHSRCEHLEAPNVYDNDPSSLDEGLTVQEKCDIVARKAVMALFPDTIIKGVEEDHPFSTEQYIADLDFSLKTFAADKSGRRKARLLKERKKLEPLFRKMRFKEYYAVKVAVESDADEDDIEYQEIVHKMFNELNKTNEPFVPNRKVDKYWLVAIDLHFEEVSVMRDSTERSHFFLSLGPEHDNMYHSKIDFANQCSL